MNLKAKYTKLKKYLRKLESAAIAFSGGLDSSFLAKAAKDALGNKAIAITAKSIVYPEFEIEDARRIAKQIGIGHLVIATGQMGDSKFIRNTKNRCYWCKRKLLAKIRTIAKTRGLKFIIDGTTYDDKNDIRPGLRANKEFFVLSPLEECCLTKQEIRVLAKKLKLPFWDKPKGTCLSSRISFGQPITIKKIKTVDKAEKIFRNLLGSQLLVRCRDHGQLLRIEIEKEKWTKLNKSDINKLVPKLKKLGYKFITFDLDGYIPAGKR